MEPAEFQLLVHETERAWRALGRVQYGPTEAERSSLRFRRSLYVAADIRAGEVLTTQNLRVVRPGFGLAPKYLDEVLGRRVNQDLRMGQAMRWEFVG
jgi:N-acetylneuraminate synthase